MRKRSEALRRASSALAAGGGTQSGPASSNTAGGGAARRGAANASSSPSSRAPITAAPAAASCTVIGGSTQTEPPCRPRTRAQPREHLSSLSRRPPPLCSCPSASESSCMRFLLLEKQPCALSFSFLYALWQSVSRRRLIFPKETSGTLLLFVAPSGFHEFKCVFLLSICYVAPCLTCHRLKLIQKAIKNSLGRNQDSPREADTWVFFPFCSRRQHFLNYPRSLSFVRWDNFYSVESGIFLVFCTH